jgi:ABC-2 type transport system ATP-binding protein
MVSIVCKKLSKAYEKKEVALRPLSLSISTNGIFALIGRNGAGKTTLVRMLATQLMPTSGSALVDGIDIIKDPKRIRDMIAVIPQEARPVPWVTPTQMVYSYLLWRGFDSKEAKIRAKDSIKKLGIQRYANTLNQSLSGGTQKKVLLASVLASEAKILFLDEPSTGLDPISRKELWAALDELKKENFIFLTTHYLEEAEALADEIAVLEEGKLLAFGSLEKLRQKIKFPYSVRLAGNVHRAIHVKKGNIITGSNGEKQLFTTRSEAYKLAKYLIKEGVEFSMNPVSLDDIFYSLVGKNIEEET